MKIRWEIEDGYCGGSRPQYVEVPDDELRECADEDAQRELVDEYIMEEFLNGNIYPVFDLSNQDQEVPPPNSEETS